MGTIVGDEPWFYHNEAEWTALVERLKLTPCPHCRTVGTLIRHGVLTGFDDQGPRPTLRARRLFCSNRHRRTGCGRTVSVWFAEKIRRLSLTTRTLWDFLQRVVQTSLAAAIRQTNCPRSDRTCRRIWSRFQRHQSAIRTALLNRGPPPQSTPTPSSRPTQAQVLAHLQSQFSKAHCPIAAFQQANRRFLV